MAQGIAVRRAPAALLAALAAGCGSASTHSSTTGAPPTAQTRTAVSTAARTTPAGEIPLGFERYRVDGFSFIAPRGLAPAPNGGVSGLPAGASVEFLTPGGKSLQKTNTQIMVGLNPKLRFDIDQVATNLRAADSTDPSLSDVHTNVSAVTVAGAAGARVVTESYLTRPPNVTAFKRTWLMVSPKPSVLMDLVVIVEPARGGTLNPASVLNSFRLDS